MTKLNGKPHRIRKRADVWWYEEAGGMCLCINGRMQPFPVIRWSAIRTALARRDAMEAKG